MLLTLFIKTPLLLLLLDPIRCSSAKGVNHAVIT